MDDATATQTTDETQQVGPGAAGPEPVLVPEGMGPRLPAMPGATVHYSRLSGRWTVDVDANLTAAQLTATLARYLPAGARLAEALKIVFQGEADRPDEAGPHQN